MVEATSQDINRKTGERPNKTRIWDNTLKQEHIQSARKPDLISLSGTSQVADWK